MLHVASEDQSETGEDDQELLLVLGRRRSPQTTVSGVTYLLPSLPSPLLTQRHRDDVEAEEA